MIFKIVRVVVYMRKDIQDQSEQIEKDGQTVTNETTIRSNDADSHETC